MASHNFNHTMDDIDERYYQNYPLTWELDESPQTRMQTIRRRSLHPSTLTAIEYALQEEEIYENCRPKKIWTTARGKKKIKKEWCKLEGRAAKRVVKGA